MGTLATISVLVALLLAAPARAEKAEPAFQPKKFVPRSAAQCTDLDARKARPQLKEFYATPKYQDGLGWCYASAAAELITHKIGRPVSGVDMAILYNHEIHSSALGRTNRNIGGLIGLNSSVDGAYEGGFIREAILAAKKYGVCSAKRMPSQIERSPDMKLGLVNLLAHIQAFNEFQEKGEPVPLEQFTQAVECSGRDGWNVTGFKEYFPGMDMRHLYNLLAARAKKDMNETLFDLAQEHCRQDRISVKNLKVKQVNLLASSSASWTKVVDSQLANGNIAGVSFYSRMLFSKIGRREGHSTTVVARKFQYGECMYLMRDSSSQGCDYYRSKLQDLCDAKTQTLWVPEADLDRYLKTIDYVE